MVRVNNPDFEAQMFSEGEGHWSLESQQKFEAHLKKLYERYKFQEKHGLKDPYNLWYG